MGEKVVQSASLYSMSSGSSCASGQYRSFPIFQCRNWFHHEHFAYPLFCSFLGMSSGSTTPRTPNATSPSSAGSVEQRLHHNHNCSTNGCLGTIPKTPSYNSHHHRGHRSHSFRVSVWSYNRRNVCLLDMRYGWTRMCFIFMEPSLPSCKKPVFRLIVPVEKAFVCLTLSLLFSGFVITA